MLSCIISRNKTSLETVYNAKHIDFVTTKQRKCFQGFLVIVSRVSSFKKNNLAVIKIFSTKPKIIHYRNFNNFSKQAFASYFQNLRAWLTHTQLEFVKANC